jgi:acetylornithine deacetylase/succinyl-diaminopimelate desuccinylase-like protein
MRGRWLSASPDGSSEPRCSCTTLNRFPAGIRSLRFWPGPGGPTLVLNGHMDTVPIDDPGLWTAKPFGAEVRDGFLYGRGSCDMKAGLTVAIAVARYLAARRDRLRGTLVCQFAIGEECAEPGTLSLCEAGFVGDVGIVLEPTELKVATAERVWRSSRSGSRVAQSTLARRRSG